MKLIIAAALAPFAPPQSEVHADEKTAAANIQVPDGWQDIATAPKDGTDILIYSKPWSAVAWWATEWDGEQIPVDEQAWYVWDGKDVLHGARRDLQKPTHWMPLPAPPTQVPSMRDQLLDEQRTGLDAVDLPEDWSPYD